MKRVTLMIPALVLTLSLAGFNAQAAKKKVAKTSSDVILHVDTAASKATWTATKKVGTHTGTVAIKEGEFGMKDGIIHTGKIVIDLTSIKNTDLTDAGYNKKLVDHLKSPDFFDVGKYPTAEFKITSYLEVHNIVAGQPNAEVKGDLTIHGITQPATLKMFVDDKVDGLVAHGKIVIDRTIYGLKYNSKKFFDPKALGDKLINDTFDVDFNLVAKK